MNAAPSSYAVVTGAGSGIGLCVAKQLLQQGWRVALVDVNAAAIQAEAKRWGEQALALTADIADAAAVQVLFEQVGAWSNGRLDFLVNNAGWLFTGHFEDEPLEHLQKMLSVNNLGPALCCRAALPLLKASAQVGRAPAVVNLSSASSIIGIPSMAVYSASKFWVHGFTEALATEWQRHGITVRSVVPPFVNTPMLTSSMHEHILLKRMGVNLAPEVVAQAVIQARTGGPLHRAVTWQLKALLILNFILPAGLMRRGVAWLGGYWPVGKEHA